MLFYSELFLSLRGFFKAFKCKTSKPNMVMVKSCVWFTSPNRMSTSGKIKSPNKQTLMEQWIKRAWQSAAPMPHNKDKRQDLEHRRTQLPNHKMPLWPNLKQKYSSYTSLSLSQMPEQEVDWTNQQAGLICKSSETHTPSVFEYEQQPSFPKSWSKMKLKQLKQKNTIVCFIPNSMPIYTFSTEVVLVI